MVKLNAYGVLGIPPNASPDEIKRAYLALMRRCHPDIGARTPDSEAQAQRLNAAYDCLKEPQRRAAYDRTLAPRFPAARSGAPASRRPVAPPLHSRVARLKRLRSVRRFHIGILAISFLLITASVAVGASLLLDSSPLPWATRYGERSASPDLRSRIPVAETDTRPPTE